MKSIVVRRNSPSVRLSPSLYNDVKHQGDKKFMRAMTCDKDFANAEKSKWIVKKKQPLLIF